MYRCKSGKHWWLSKEDAEKCCNGYKRVLCIGDIQGCDRTVYEDETETMYGYKWVPIFSDCNADKKKGSSFTLSPE